MRCLRQFLLLSVFLITLVSFWACEPEEENPTPEIAFFIIDSAWTSGGGRNENSFRNHHYTFDVTENNTEVKITGQSDVAGGWLIYVKDSQNRTLTVPTRNDTITETLNVGTYTLVVATSQQGASADYQLSVSRTNTTQPTPLSGIVESTQNDSWKSGYGSGTAFFGHVSFRHHHYLFEVTENNTFVDLFIETAITDGGSLVVLNENNEILTNIVRPPTNLTLELNAGSYKVVAMTNARGGRGDYELKIIGKIVNIRRDEAQEVSRSGSWTSAGGFNANAIGNESYTFEITEDNTYFDLVLETSITGGANYYLKNSLGTVISTGNRARQSSFGIAQLNKGSYELVVAASTGASGTYTLDLWGKFTNLQKK